MARKQGFVSKFVDCFGFAVITFFQIAVFVVLLLMVSDSRH